MFAVKRGFIDSTEGQKFNFRIIKWQCSEINFTRIEKDIKKL